MDIEINEVSTTVRAVDGDTLVSPHVLQRIVAAVVRAVREGQSHDRRATAERAITDGVSAERDAD